MEKEKVYVQYLNNVYMRVSCDPGLRYELMEYFSFRPPGYQFVPSYKNKMWDGWFRLYNPMKPVLLVGLLHYLVKFCNDRDYELEIDQILLETNDNFSKDNVDDLVRIGTNGKLIPHDYQIEYVLNAIKTNRSLSLSPTSSGKSFIMKLLQIHYDDAYELKTLIIVPNIGLVHQLANDFIDYGTNPSDIYRIMAGVDKNVIMPKICISTWQSLTKMPKEWFDQFGVIFGDEAHLFAAKSLTSIMEKIDAKYRHGFTGTISSESKVHKLVLEGLFGPVKKFVSTKDLIEAGTVADFKIKGLILNYDAQTKKDFRQLIKSVDKTKKYSTERLFLFKNDKRNKFIRNLVWSLKDQNNLILFDQVENHGKLLKPMLEKEDRILHFIYGDTSGEDRENVRKIIENDNTIALKIILDNKHEFIITDKFVSNTNNLLHIEEFNEKTIISKEWISFKYKIDYNEINVEKVSIPNKRHDILASFGTFSTGTSIKRIDNAIYASAFKTEIKTLQSIGRTLRRGNGSDYATLYDITDNLSNNNYTLQHFNKRIEIYSTENFDYKIFNIDI